MKKSGINPENAAATIFGDSRTSKKEKEVKLVLSFPVWLHDAIYELSYRTGTTMKQMMHNALSQFVSQVDTAGDRRQIDTYNCIFAPCIVDRYDGDGGNYRSSVYLPISIYHDVTEIAHYARHTKSVVYCHALWTYVISAYASQFPDICGNEKER